MTEKYVTEACDGYSLVDNTTGEIKELKIHKKIKQDDFIMVFFKSFNDLQNLDDALLKLLFIIWRECSFNPQDSDDGNVVTNDLYFKKKVRDGGLDYTDNAINTYVNRLTKQNILIKLCKGRYMLNPKYFFKGRLVDASKLQLTLEVDN